MIAEDRAGPVLEVDGLEMRFEIGRGPFSGRSTVRAIDGVSFTIGAGETLALVGESGSGKTTVGRCVLRLLEPTGGRIVFRGDDITRASRRRLRPVRRYMHIVFQDPYSSLNPRMTIGRIVAGPLRHHGIGSRREVEARVGEMLERVGLRPELQRRYPHSLSGGQRQRVAIARALILGPTLLVADEPISALDASVQASMLNLLVSLQKEMRFACLFITHDLSAAHFIADRTAVMYLGQLVETGATSEVLSSPRHPYTQSLVSSVLIPDPAMQRGGSRLVLSGDPPSPIDLPTGCRFHGRCPIAIPRCVTDEPELLAPPGDEHHARCHLVGADGSAPVVPGLRRVAS
jgi:oligopeptide/dipeptide ABC transporter ATP-binding protein